MENKNPKPRSAKTRRGVARAEPGDPPASAAALDHEEIARVAYSYWEARGCNGGSPEEDWFRAENELRAKRAASGL
jgi:hypothetical protein